MQRIKAGMIRREGTDANKPTSTQLLHIEFNSVSPEAKSKCKSEACVTHLRYRSRTHKKSTTEEERGKQHLEGPICIFFLLDSW